jgi:hypothetical protein
MVFVRGEGRRQGTLFPWGYAAGEILRYLSDAQYRWFQLLPDGRMDPVDTERQEYDGNFVAVLEERIASLLGVVQNQ